MTGVEHHAGLPIHLFPDRAALERWLATASRGNGIWLKLAKKNAAEPSVSKADAIDAGLCHGWIDGQLAPYDAHHWLIRFTPRRASSKWSEKNRARASELIAAGQMQPAGMTEIEAAKADGRWDTAYAPASTAQVPEDLQAALDASPGAAAFFATLKGANRYAILHRVTTAKKPETRARRVAQFVDMLERGETIHG